MNEVTKITKSIIVRSQVKDMAKIEGEALNVSSDFYAALDEKVKRIVEESCKRAKLNNRNTVMDKDV